MLNTQKKIFAGILVLLFITQIVHSQQGNVVYEIEATFYRNDSAALESITALRASSTLFPSEETGYRVEVVSNLGTTLFKRNVFLPFEGPTPFGIPANGSEEFIPKPVNETWIDVKVPYFSSATRIVFYHSDKIILDIDLSRDFCNRNGACDLGENVYNCPGDCSSVTTQPQTTSSTTTLPSSVNLLPQTTIAPKNGGSDSSSIVALVAAIVLVAGLAYYFYKKRLTGN